MNWNWNDLAAMAACLTAVSAALYWAARGRLGVVFVSRAEFAEVERRMGEVEKQVKATPTHDDFKKLAETLVTSARDLAVVTERMNGMKEGLVRIEREIGLLVQARLEWEKVQ